MLSGGVQIQCYFGESYTSKLSHLTMLDGPNGSSIHYLDLISGNIVKSVHLYNPPDWEVEGVCIRGENPDIPTLGGEPSSPLE